ncbi:MAG: methylated-DNA--[protein]-cysteine S-methyltransferase [Chloroflexi bacterium]|nr:methylated-DNA--[protein]-cysteine S-methyltransferase [Chloroflexota bacterium]
MESSTVVGNSLAYDVVESPFGWVGILVSPRGLRRTSLPEPSIDAAMSALGPELGQATHDVRAVEPYAAKIASYLRGEAVDLTLLPVDPDRGTDFFHRAWAACRTIPAGETRSYGWLAEAAGHPRAMRAAGQAMARNPLPLAVPCHRVVGSDGGLHGFGGSVGVPLKKRLLELERRGAGVIA